MGRLLEAALERIPRSAFRERRIARIRLGPVFTIVELDDRATGAAMNYSGLSAAEREALRLRLESSLAGDPLLLRATASAGAGLAELSLRVAVASALALPAIRAGGDSVFRVSRQAPFAFFDDVRVAVVVGFGGYMRMLARRPGVTELHVVDLGYKRRRVEMDSTAAKYREARPDLSITISGDTESLNRLMPVADVVCLTGSALCNGTMETLLASAAGCKRIIVQGQSAALHPDGLFRSRVAAVTTTIKPSNLIDLADLDLLDSVLESDASGVYLWPTGTADS